MNCREGDLALVIGPAGVPEVGQTVKCLKLFTNGESLMHLPVGPNLVEITAFGPTWYVDRVLTARLPPWPEVASAPQVLIPFKADRYLMPIRPERDPEEIQTEREVKA